MEIEIFQQCEESECEWQREGERETENAVTNVTYGKKTIEPLSRCKHSEMCLFGPFTKCHKWNVNSDFDIFTEHQQQTNKRNEREKKKR